MATNKIIESKYKNYVIMIRELIDKIKETENNSTHYSRSILAFPREHLSIKDPNGKYLTDKKILKIIKKGIDMVYKK